MPSTAETTNIKFYATGLSGGRVFRGDTPDINDFIFYITDASMQGGGYGEGDLNKLVFNNCVLFTNSFGMANTG